MYPPPACKGPNVAWMHRITPPLHSTSPLARKEEEEEDRDGSRHRVEWPCCAGFHAHGVESGKDLLSAEEEEQ